MYRTLLASVAAAALFAGCAEQPPSDSPRASYDAPQQEGAAQTGTSSEAPSDRSAARSAPQVSPGAFDDRASGRPPASPPPQNARSSAPPDPEPGTTSRTTHERRTYIRETTITEREIFEDLSTRHAAIFVVNRGGARTEGREGTFQDMLVARLSGHPRLSIISRENVLNAVSRFAETGPNRGFYVPPDQDLDRLLSNRSSALQLARLMGADFVLIARITSYDPVTRQMPRQADSLRLLEETLRLSYEVLDRNRGATVHSDMVVVEKRTRLDGIEGGTIDNLNHLLDEGSQRLVEAFNGRVLPPAPRPGERVELIVHTTVADLDIPDVVRNEAGEWVIDRRRFPIAVDGVTVEMNGVVEGSAPGVLLVEPGANKIRLSHPGFRDWEHTINVRDRAVINAALMMTDEHRHRMRQDMAFFENLRINQKLTDGYLDVLQGYAQMLRQSGYRVDVRHEGHYDIRHDFKIDADHTPSFWVQ